MNLACPDCSLVLISIDTLRADHLGSYGYSRATSPHIDALAREGVRFARAYSACYHTADSHMSMFTADYPSVHGVQNVMDATQAVGLDPRIETLPERLSESGFHCVGFHGGGNVSAPYGFGRGFDSYKATFSDVKPALAWLADERLQPRERFFLFFHTYRTHDPYLPDPPYDRLWMPDYKGSVISNKQAFESMLTSSDFGEKRRLFWNHVDPSNSEDLAKIQALYDGKIREADDEIGRLLDAVGRLSQRVLIVLVSDHGEEFHEHGHFLHDQVYEECLHVPFIIRHPDGVGAGAVETARVSLVNLAPTLLDLLGVPPLRTGQGVSLAPYLRETTDGSLPGYILAEKVLGTDPKTDLPTIMKQALILHGEKLVQLPDGSRQLFDLRSDPHEKKDLAASSPNELTRLAQTLTRLRTRNLELRKRLLHGSSGPKTKLDEATIKSLEALGYLH